MRPTSSLSLLFYAFCLLTVPTEVWAADAYCKKWQDVKMSAKGWDSAYDGYGKLYFNQGVHLQPRSIASESGTHAALALTKPHEAYKDFVIRLRYENVKALRAPAANTWEVFWLFFNYKKTATGKNTNYFIFKPNGVELGTARNEVDQEFLFTSNSPKASFGKTYELTLIKKGQHVRALIDGKVVMDFKSKPGQPLFDESGQLGLYTEDAQVHVKSVSLCSDQNLS